jgi:hypothetical protein
MVITNGLNNNNIRKKNSNTGGLLGYPVSLSQKMTLNENKPFWVIWEYFSSSHMCFSVAGHSGQNHKKADLSLKINFFQNFRSRLEFLVQFYPYLELELKKYAQGQELLIIGVFFEKLSHCDMVQTSKF